MASHASPSRAVLGNVQTNARQLQLNGDGNLLGFSRMRVTQNQIVSPDEEILHQRGRRSYEPHSPINIARYPLTEYELSVTQKKRVLSPIKSLHHHLSPRKSFLRSSRDFAEQPGLTLSSDEAESLGRSPQKRSHYLVHGSDVPPLANHSSKRICLLPFFDIAESASDPYACINSLNKDQLRSVLRQTLSCSPEHVKTHMSFQIPTVDLDRMETKLLRRLRYVQIASGKKLLSPQKQQQAQRQIREAPVDQEFVSSNISPPLSIAFFKRIHPALEEFRAKIASHVDALQKGEQWISAVEYVLRAWPYVRQLPEWREQVQDRTRVACFKLLAKLLRTALPLCNGLNDAHKESLSHYLNAMRPDCPQADLPFVTVSQNSSNNTSNATTPAMAFNASAPG